MSGPGRTGLVPNFPKRKFVVITLQCNGFPVCPRGPTGKLFDLLMRGTEPKVAVSGAIAPATTVSAHRIVVRDGPT